MATGSMAPEDFLKQGQQLWEMLDEMAASSPENYQAFIQKHLSEGAHMFKPPQPVMALHCKVAERAHDCQDLYINVCSWQQIPKPKSDQDPIPVRGGSLRNRTVQTNVQSSTSSKQGQIFDLAFNPDVLKECLEDAETERMLVELSLDYIEEQVGLRLNRNSCVKLKEKCIGTRRELHGSLNEQCKHLLVRTDEPSAVRLPSAASRKHCEKPNSCTGTESVTDALYNVTLADEGVGFHERGGASAPPVSTASKPSGLIQQVGGEGEVVPKYRVWTEVDGSRVCVEVELPGVNKVAEVDLDLIENALELSVVGRYAVSIALPQEVKEEGIRATFSPQTHVLRVVLPVL